MFFQPYRNYVITRQIYNERDFGQVWVKAWVRDAITDEALLDGVEMAESTDEKGRFKYTYKMPADPSGNGRQLRVITVVYEDSGYASRNLNYQVEETDAVVRDMNIMGHSGGGGSDIDYKKVREIVKEELAKIPPYPELDLSDIKKEVKDAKNAISGLIKGLPETDLSEIEDKIEQLIKVIASIPAPDKPDEFDYSKLESILELLNLNSKELKAIFKDIKTDLKFVEPNLPYIKTVIEKSVKDNIKGLKLIKFDDNSDVLEQILNKLDEK